MTQNIAQALHDGETEAEARTPLGPIGGELMVLLEDRLEVFLRYADAGVPGFDAKPSFAPPAPDQHFAVRGVFQSVG